MEPSHKKQAFEAQRIFTDREDAVTLFRDAFDGSQSPDDYRVISWHGIVGQGKSALARELIKTSDKISEAKKSHKIALPPHAGGSK